MPRTVAGEPSPPPVFRDVLLDLAAADDDLFHVVVVVADVERLGGGAGRELLLLGDLDLVVARLRALEVLDRGTETVAELRQLAGAEDDEDDEQDDEQFAHAGHTHSSVASRATVRQDATTLPRG